MIMVSNDYKTAINADVRNIKPRVLAYFDGDGQPPIELDENTIVDIHLLEEAHAESDNPLGLVSANETTISFDNSSRDFTPTNLTSPYYDKLRPNLLIKPYLGLETSPGTFEYVPLGVFRTGDWSAPSESVEATVTGYDKLYELGNKDIPMLPVQTNTTVAGMFELLFQVLGLAPDQYEIDISLNQPIQVGWFPKGKVRDAFQVLAIAGNCNVSANRYGVVRVKNNFKSGNAVVTLTDNDQIIIAENPQKYLDTYNKVSMIYKTPYLKKSDSLLKIDSIAIPNGGFIFQNLAFSGPVAIIDQISLVGAKNAVVESIEYGTWSITVSVSNSGPAETVSLEVFGRMIETLNSTSLIQDEYLLARWGERELKIDNEMIQDKEVATLYAQSLLSLLKDPYMNLSLDVRGDPALEVNDIVEIQDQTDKIGIVDALPIRITLNYDGGLGGRIEARKPIAPHDWVFMSPGLYAYVPRDIVP
ncbi:MAG: hypothetical protein C4589_10995 [Peptococcaceae bacterium]|nr:MAG: hypothetical protein C4589_10995 [Peptococcaceae bacterium]